MDAINDGLLVLAGIFAVVVIGGVALLLRVALKVTEKLATEEARGWLATLSGGLVSDAVERLPESERGRYDEEWRAELSELLDRPLTAFVWALHIRRGARMLATEAPPVAAGGTTRWARAVGAVPAFVRHARRTVGPRLKIPAAIRAAWDMRILATVAVAISVPAVVVAVWSLAGGEMSTGSRVGFAVSTAALVINLVRIIGTLLRARTFRRMHLISAQEFWRNR